MFQNLLNLFFKRNDSMSMIDLPSEVLINIGSFFNEYDLRQIRQSCNRFYSLFNDEKLNKFVQSKKTNFFASMKTNIQSLEKNDFHHSLCLGRPYSLVHYGSCILTLENNTTLALFNLDTRKKIHLLKGHTDRINSFIKLNMHRVASVSDDCTIRVWDIPSAKCMLTINHPTGDKGGIKDIVKLSDTHVAILSALTKCDDDRRRALSIVDLQQKKLISSLTCASRKNGKGFSDKAFSNIILLKDNQFVCWGELGCQLYSFDLSNNTITRMRSLVDCPITFVKKLSPSALLINFPNYHINFGIYDLIQNKYQRLIGHQRHIIDAIALNKHHIMSISYDGSYRIWDVNTKACLSVVELIGSKGILSRDEGDDLCSIIKLDDDRIFIRVSKYQLQQIASLAYPVTIDEGQNSSYQHGY